MKSFAFSIFLSILSYAGISQVRFTPRRMDMGVVREVEGPVKAIFTYKNVGREPLVVLQVTTSCGCTGVEYPTSPLAAGDSARMVVIYDPKDRPGVFEKQITVRTTAGNEGLLICGVVEPRPRTIEDDFPYLVARSVRLSALVVGVERAQIARPYFRSIKVINSSTTVPVVVGVDTTGLPPWVEVLVKKPYLGAGEQTQVEFRLTGNQIGSFSADIPLTVDGVRLAEKIWLHALFTRNFEENSQKNPKGEPKMEVSAFFYHFSTQKLGQTLRHSFVIENKGATDLVIDKIESSVTGQLWATISSHTIKPGAKATLAVEAKPKTTGIFNETIRLITNQPTQPVREVRIMADIL